MDDFEFYVEKDSNGDGVQQVHRQSCSALPEKDTLYYMGVRSNPDNALREAANWFSGAVPCPHCMPN